MAVSSPALDPMKNARIRKSFRLIMGAFTWLSIMKNATRQTTATPKEPSTNGEVQPMELVP